MRRFFIVGLVLALAGCVKPEPLGRKYLVFYEALSAQLDDASKITLGQAATQAKEAPGLRVLVVGYADPEGSPQANRDVSRLRAQVAADALAAFGVPASRIDVRARGAVGFFDSAQESRRVEVSVGAAP